MDHSNYRHIAELQRIAKAKGWSKHRLKSERGQLLSRSWEEANKYINTLRRKEFT